MENQAVETVVSKEWCSALGVNEANKDDDFFSLGGDSMLALEFVSKVEQELKISFAFEVLFVDGTFGAVLDECEQKTAANQDG